MFSTSGLLWSAPSLSIKSSTSLYARDCAREYLAERSVFVISCQTCWLFNWNECSSPLHSVGLYERGANICNELGSGNCSQKSENRTSFSSSANVSVAAIAIPLSLVV